MRRPRNTVQEIHIAIVGMNGSGKSALTVKYLTRRYITEYDPTIEDTYCKHETIDGQEYMVWIMDTVEEEGRDASRYLAWADIFLVVYSITSLQSLDTAKKILNRIAAHDHSYCLRQHVTLLLGNKMDLERYRQVSKAQGSSLAAEFQAEFFELNTTEEYSLVKNAFHTAIASAMVQKRTPITQRSPSPKQVVSGDSDGGNVPSAHLSPPSVNPSPKGSFAGSLARRSKSPAAKVHEMIRSNVTMPQQQTAQHLQPPTSAQPPKKTSGLKLFKLFQQ